jgi:prenyltransferase beta subunit
VTELHKESRMIGFHALDIIHKVMELGRNLRNHPPYGWRDHVTVNEHLSKCCGHIVKYTTGSKDPNDDEDHLHHALCRLAMAVYNRDMVKDVR